jgi:hypothetical protein
MIDFDRFLQRHIRGMLKRGFPWPLLQRKEVFWWMRSIEFRIKLDKLAQKNRVATL